MLKSSSTTYVASGSQSSRLNCPQKYMCGPRDLAHSVFPSLDSPHKSNERGRSTSVYQKTAFRETLPQNEGGDWGPPDCPIGMRGYPRTSKDSRAHSANSPGSTNSALLLPVYPTRWVPQRHSQNSSRRPRLRHKSRG